MMKKKKMWDKTELKENYVVMKTEVPVELHRTDHQEWTYTSRVNIYWRNLNSFSIFVLFFQDQY